jgi:hypothetical protein
MFEVAALRVVQISGIECLVEVIEQLDFGSLGNPGEAREITVLETSESFRDVSRRGSRCFPDLAMQLEVVRIERAATKRPDRAPKRVGELPCTKVFE